MARRSSTDRTIGERIKTRRLIRGWSVRFTADRAGISHSTLSRIERGVTAADNRYVIADIAAALECSVADLTGVPVPSQSPDNGAAQAGVWAVRQALLATDLTEEPDTAPRPMPELDQETALVRDLRARSDYVGLGRILPRLLQELHAAAAGTDKEQALRLMVDATYAAALMMRNLGYPADSWLAAERCQEAAEALEHPVLLGLAAFTRSQTMTSCGLYNRTLAITGRAVDQLDGHPDVPGGLEVLGTLNLTCAYASRGLKRPDDSAGWFRQAGQVAARTGDTDTFGLSFGPTILNMYEISMETDAGEPGRAVEIARRTNPAVIASPGGQSAYYTDTARALSRVRKDREALRYLLIAERMAPQRVHNSALVQETARSLLERSQRRAGGTELRGLCERMGIAAV